MLSTYQDVNFETVIVFIISGILKDFASRLPEDFYMWWTQKITVSSKCESIDAIRSLFRGPYHPTCRVLHF